MDKDLTTKITTSADGKGYVLVDFFLSSTSNFNQKGNIHKQKIVKYFIILSSSISKYTHIAIKRIEDNITKMYFRIFQTPTKAAIQDKASASNIFNPLLNIEVL